MKTLFGVADALAQERRPFALCTVVETARSAPRDAGARMLVRDDGSIEGTVGGGPLEAVVIAEALSALRAQERGTRLLEAELTTEGEVHLGMKCGGSVKVLVDVHRPSPRVVVLGAGHVGLKVAEAVLVAGWDVLAADDRPERLALVPGGVPTRRFEADDVGASLQDVGDEDFVVIVTRCHDIDERALLAAMRTKARYVGLIGSKRKIAVLFRNLRRDGAPDPSQDPRVFAPIGLDIGGKEPGEIAIAVVAELLAVRDRRVPGHRRLPPRRRADASDDASEGMDAPLVSK